ncbi:19S proteasome regulatory subunit Rpn502 [Schizosaccharomyces japonicus yFS275]|uniref:19S proteasome regulatory subunit Rpn502 n=1 Tax=Schizosaccharomyces japonicus (strain yFS275 / FY16936) TaxID=402676 RepID=B6K3X5_SCHJY|nr:19S proteasome regulatory subunit Rpn502 [Schizosaccharomyces japonicus yFS275]EEB08182.2 19S proteasome regulatory subunit Rpn502 [Schizosaccharomyces japonicus yFS275]
MQPYHHCCRWSKHPPSPTTSIQKMAELKPEKDFTEEYQALIDSLDRVKIDASLEKLLIFEKQVRQASDNATNTKILIYIADLLYQAKDYKLLNEQLVSLSKKHGQLKQAMTSLVQHVMGYLDDIKDKKIKIDLIETLRGITDGKIYVEIERARLTRLLSNIREEEGKIEEAKDILCNEPVETYASLDQKEKVDLILEQVRLHLLCSDYYMASTFAKKISVKFFEKEEVQDLKLKYYEQKIRIGLHEDAYLDVCKYYRVVYDTASIQADPEKWREILENVVCFVLLAPYDNEQADLLQRVNADRKLSSLPLLQQLVKCFTINELMRWPRIAEIYGEVLRSTAVFAAGDEKGEKRWSELRKRVIEHNLRVIAKYYTRIRCDRLSILLDLSAEETEQFLSELITKGHFYARIDRPAGTVSFKKAKNVHEQLNEWSASITFLLNRVEKTRQLILKEEMMYSIQQEVAK